MEYNSLASHIDPMESSTPTTTSGTAGIRTTVSISSSHFISNTGETVSIHPTGSGTHESHIGFGRGGAVSLFMLDSEISHGLELNIRDCTFHNNTAAWGGAVYARFRGQSSSNTIRIRDSYFTENKANFSGGAFFVTTTQLEDYNNTIHLDRCLIHHNQAQKGGGLSYKSIAAVDYMKRSRSTIRDTNFTRNIAKVFLVKSEK